jgi:acetolactate synthase-1/2/3 large subunit
VVEIEDAARIPELVARAFRVATQGRPGPVVIALPEDMLHDEADVPDAPAVIPVETAPLPADISTLGDLLAGAERPLLVVGGSRWSPEACAQLIAFAEAHRLPVSCVFRRAMLFPADHALYVGDLGLGANPVLTAAVRDADLLILLGTRMSEVASSSYELIACPTPRQRLVHIHADALEVGRVYQPTLGINATPTAFLGAVCVLEGRTGSSDHAASLRAAYLDWSETPAPLPGLFQYGEVMQWLRERLPADAVLTNGAGNYASWLHRYYRFRAFGTQLAPTSGSMGYGVPAAIMAKRHRPEAIVIALAGDGDFLMNGQEFATACQYGIPLIVLVIDNSMYGTIRMHQERAYPGRISATDLKNPDFAALARAYGGYGETVRETAEFAPAFERALASGQPAIIHCFLDPQAITPTASLDQIRAAARKQH